jgi:hypothetical protein
MNIFPPKILPMTKKKLKRFSRQMLSKFSQVSISSNFFPSLLTMRPNELEGLSLETLSSQVLEFEVKARANPIGAPSRCFLLG